MNKRGYLGLLKVETTRRGGKRQRGGQRTHRRGAGAHKVVPHTPLEVEGGGSRIKKTNSGEYLPLSLSLSLALSLTYLGLTWGNLAEVRPLETSYRFLPLFPIYFQTFGLIGGNTLKVNQFERI